MPGFVMKMMAATPTGTITEPESITSGIAVTDTIHGKYCPYQIWKRIGNISSSMHDLLADMKNHTWRPFFLKLMGLTTDITAFERYHAFRTSDSGRYNIYDYLYSTANIKMKMRGKLFKMVSDIHEDMDVNIYIEQYPVNITHLSVEEYKQLRKDRDDRIPFELPGNLLPPLPAAESLKERVLSTRQ